MSWPTWVPFLAPCSRVDLICPGKPHLSSSNHRTCTHRWPIHSFSCHWRWGDPLQWSVWHRLFKWKNPYACTWMERSQELLQPGNWGHWLLERLAGCQDSPSRILEGPMLCPYKALVSKRIFSIKQLRHWSTIVDRHLFYCWPYVAPKVPRVRTWSTCAFLENRLASLFTWQRGKLGSASTI